MAIGDLSPQVSRGAPAPPPLFYYDATVKKLRIGLGLYVGLCAAFFIALAALGFGGAAQGRNSAIAVAFGLVCLPVGLALAWIAYRISQER